MMRDGTVVRRAMMWGTGLLIVAQPAVGIAALAKYLFRSDR
jgi:hypothetical protein